jgi:putative membrane protein
MAHEYEKTENAGFGIIHFLYRLIVGAVVLAITAFITPGFTISGFWPLLFAALVLAALDYIIVKTAGIDATPYGRGLTGFVLAAVIIYITKFLVAGYEVSVLGALLGALVYGLIDMIVPGRAM